MERNPKLRQTSMSTSASFSVSAQCWILPVLKHSPEIPALAVNSEPSGGAASPLRARQTIAPSFHIARATPEAPVSRPALSAMVLNIESRGRSPTSIRSFRGASAALSSVPGPMPGGRMERLFEASSEELRSNTESSVEKRNGLDSGTPTNLPQLAIIPRNAGCAPTLAKYEPNLSWLSSQARPKAARRPRVESLVALESLSRFHRRILLIPKMSHSFAQWIPGKRSSSCTKLTNNRVKERVLP